MFYLAKRFMGNVKSFNNIYIITFNLLKTIKGLTGLPVKPFLLLSSYVHSVEYLLPDI